MRKLKILYMMHVHWSWIKQRPHFIAEYLTENYDVTVCFDKSYRYAEQDICDNRYDLKFKELFVLPFKRIAIIANINKWLLARQLSCVLTDYDIVWVTHPDLYDVIKNSLSHEITVVYDCMDDALEFPLAVNNPSLRRYIESCEGELIARCNILIASSLHLKEKLLSRYSIDKAVHVLNNAINIYDNQIYDESKIPRKLIYTLSNNKSKIILYLGTISSWLDLDVIMESVKRYTGITYILIGPVDVVIPQHERIVYIPPVEHKYIFTIMDRADALLMPFLINELVLSVNPVKLYEYIYSLKPSIICKYEETEKFIDYVHLYTSREEYYDLVEQLLAGKLTLKMHQDKYLEFALRNTWNERASDIFNILNLHFAS